MKQLSKRKKRGCPTCDGIDAKSCMRCYGKTRMCDWYDTKNGWDWIPTQPVACAGCAKYRDPPSLTVSFQEDKEMNELSKNQKALMKHTVSGHNRNWFGTSKNCEDSIEFEKLVEAGFATSEKPPPWMGDDVIYRLTAAGKAAIQPIVKADAKIRAA